MKKTLGLAHPILAAVAALTLTACGNDGLLSALSGGTSEPTAQQQAIGELAANVCGECTAPEGTAEVLFVDVTPEEYAGGALELGIVVGDPLGLRNEDGSWRVQISYTINGYDLFAAINSSAWKLSPDGTKARVVLLALDGLPAGGYHVHGDVIDEEGGADGGGADGGGGEAGDDETYECPGEDQPHDDPPPPDGEPTDDHPPTGDEPPAGGDEPPPDGGSDVPPAEG